jgi:hypothetical protein
MCGPFFAVDEGPDVDNADVRQDSSVEENMKFIIPVMLLAGVAMPLSAADVIRSVDQEGTATYSDRPVPGDTDLSVMEIDAPAPAGESLTESQREARAVINKANRLQQQTNAAKSDKTAAGASARQELEHAKADLEAAKVIGEGDRQALAGGGSKLTPEYRNRIQAAEKRLEEARKQLDQAD